MKQMNMHEAKEKKKRNERVLKFFFFLGKRENIDYIIFLFFQFSSTLDIR